MLPTDDTIVAISTAAGSADRAIVRLSGTAAIELADRLFHSPAGPLANCGGFTTIDGLVRIRSGDAGRLAWHGHPAPAAFSSSTSSCSAVSSSAATTSSALPASSEDKSNNTTGGTPVGRMGETPMPLSNPPTIELPARAYVFRGPRSYTRQDVCELHIPGSAVAAGSLLDAAIAMGARQGAPGEFTARAFLSGRLDLSAAEAVADIIDAASDAQLRSGVAALGGEIHRRCGRAAGEIADVLAGAEASIDLADEDIHLDRPADLAKRLHDAGRALAELTAAAIDLPDSAAQSHVVLTGRPNVGKSSLLNALTQTNRSIVSSLAGTTRDVLSSTLELPGGCTVLQDAAGLGLSGAGEPAANEQLADELDAAGRAAARKAVAAADVILFVVDASGDDRADDDLALMASVRSANRLAPMILLANKVDLLPAGRADEALANWRSRSGMDVLAISAQAGVGLEQVRTALAAKLNLSAGRAGESLGLHRRQKRCLVSACEALARAEELLAACKQVADAAELLAVELRCSLAQLGQISGQIVTEDILGRIFARFCVGK